MIVISVEPQGFSKLTLVKKMGHILIVLAAMLLLLHTLLPHEHHSELDAIEHFQAHQQASSIFDYLRLAFHFSPGQNHLEDYQTSGYDLSLISPFILINTDQPVVLMTSETLVKNIPPYLSELRIKYLHPSLSFRGPPRLV